MSSYKTQWKPNFRKVSLVSHIWDELGKREPKGMENSLRVCDSNLDVIEIWPRMGTAQMDPFIWTKFSDGQFQTIMLNIVKK